MTTTPTDDDSPETGPKETAYDEQIAPLMATIIGICKAHKINAHATFVLDVPDADDDGEQPYAIKCTTHLPVDDADVEGMGLLRQMLTVARPPAALAFAVTTLRPDR